MEIGWLVQTRPDISCSFGMMVQVTDGYFKADQSTKLRTLNKVIHTVKESQHRGLTQIPLDLSTMHIRAYAYGYFSNNQYLSSLLGYNIIFLFDDNYQSSVPVYRSFICLRVVRSVLGAEVCAFADAFGQAFAIQSVIEQCYCKRVPIRMLTDSKSLFDVIKKESTTTEKRPFY